MKKLYTEDEVIGFVEYLDKKGAHLPPDTLGNYLDYYLRGKDDEVIRAYIVWTVSEDTHPMIISIHQDREDAEYAAQSNTRAYASGEYYLKQAMVDAVDLPVEPGYWTGTETVWTYGGTMGTWVEEATIG